MVELYILDVDGTIVEPMGTDVYPEVIDRLKRLETPYALASNQGGVGMRVWAERDRAFAQWLKSRGLEIERLFCQEDVDARMDLIVSNLVKGGLPKPVEVLVSFAYRNRLGQWGPSPDKATGDPRWRQDWRKPAPGMNLEILNRTSVRIPRNVLCVGDKYNDRSAAENAGCAFQSALQFFGPRVDPALIIRKPY